MPPTTTHHFGDDARVPTAAACPHGRHHTGDVGYLDADTLLTGSALTGEIGETQPRSLTQA